jgi:hypothetical protein
VSDALGETAASRPRDRFIPLRKSDIVDGLAAAGCLDDAQQQDLRTFARMLGAIFHYRYFEELDRLRAMYFDFDPEVEPKQPTHDRDATYRRLSDEFVRIVTEANFVEISHDEIARAFAEHALVRVRIKAPVTDFRDVRMFRRGHHKETIQIPSWLGLRRRPLDVEVYDDVVLMVATKPDATKSGGARKGRTGKGKQKIRGDAVLFKYFRHIARGDLEALFPNVRVVMSLFDQLAIGVPALVGGVPILLKLASTLTVLFLVAGFYLGLSGTIRDNDTEQALAALSGLFALGALAFRQWGNFHRQSLIHQKQLTDNIYYRNINNNSGIFNYLIGEAEEQDWKEALLAYYVVLTEKAPLARAADLGARVEELLARLFDVRVSFEFRGALARLRDVDLLCESASDLSVAPLDDALARLEGKWADLLREPSAGSR